MSAWAIISKCPFLSAIWLSTVGQKCILQVLSTEGKKKWVGSATIQWVSGICINGSKTPCGYQNPHMLGVRARSGAKARYLDVPSGLPDITPGPQPLHMPSHLLRKPLSTLLEARSNSHVSLYPSRRCPEVHRGQYTFICVCYLKQIRILNV